jgi:(1->4)-alpha-D-glucan 1-alpha-D-glucosylmutase
MTTQKNSARLEAAIAEIAAQRRIPAATYRLQFHAGFTFKDAQALLGYFDELGISDLYGSPIFLPRVGSTHGYDVSDPTQLNSALGSEEEFDALSSGLQKRGMGFVLDVVPNHMGINDPRNLWWMDVLENGPSSPFASFFDIQWNPIFQELENKVLLPILGDQYGVVLERGELKLNYTSGAFHISYFENIFPLTPRSYIPILRLVLENMQETLGGIDETAPLSSTALSAAQSSTALNASQPHYALLELESIMTALNYLPSRTASEPAKLIERSREKEIIKRRLDTLHSESAELRAALEAVVITYNGEVGKPQSFDLLDALIDQQAYRLAFWRVAGEEINYRRFFDINELAAIRVEDPEVFTATHALALRLLAQGKATGLRIDHPDGLYDPVTYFCRLQAYYLAAKLQDEVDGETEEEIEASREQLHTTIDQWLQEQARQPHAGSRDSQQVSQPASQWPLYVVVEKILSESEPLPLDWAVYGTTGYSFLAAANGIFVDKRNERAFSRLYNRFSGSNTPLNEIAFSTKMMIMRESLAGEITTLTYELERIGERNRHYRDFTLGGLRTAVREVIGSLAIYRTYIDAHQGIVSERDRRFMQAAVRAAKRRHPLLDDTLFDYIRDTVLLRNLEQFREEDRPRVADWVMKFQQLTGPIMAKGVEDTAFYRYNRLVSLNEVGDHPAQFGISVEQFHEENSRRAALWPHTMLATSTHDNKRSEDVRARINLLSEMPDLWQSSLRQWSRFNGSKKRELDGEAAPDANDEYFFYQTILGTWPIAQESQSPADNPWGFLLQPKDTEDYQDFRKRISDYMLKAAKEAKVYTSWLNPYVEYEEALLHFVDRVLQPSSRNRFLIAFAPMARMIAYFGQFNSLAQTVLKLTAPGVPDLYQGNELWDFSLVDPDNRRPVDYAQRSTLLKKLQSAGKRKGSDPLRLAQSLVKQSHDGRIKLFVTHRTLCFRRDHYDLFTGSAYIPLEVMGEQARHLCAYLRQTEPNSGAGEQALVVVPRLVATLTGRAERPPTGPDVWGDTQLVLPAGNEGRTYHNLYTGESVTVTEQEGHITLPAAKLLAHFPVALLTPVG